MAFISVTYESGRTADFEPGTHVIEALVSAGPFPRPPVAALVDNELKSLDAALLFSCRLAPVFPDSAAGALVYLAPDDTTALVVAQAAGASALGLAGVGALVASSLLGDLQKMD